MHRRSARSDGSGRRSTRVLVPVAAAALGVGLLAAPALADAAPTAPPAAPVVTPSTTAGVTVGTPMTMTIAPGAAADHVYGYAWSWQSAAPTYSTLPSCGSDTGAGGIHFVCGSSVTVRVSPEQPPFPTFTVYAFDAAGNRSPATTVRVNAFDAGESLFPVTHQWTTDEYQAVPAPATCGGTLLSVRCVPDTAGVDARHPNGARPLLLPAGVTWDGSGGGVPGVLTFGPASTAPAATVLPAVDLRQSFTAGAWLTPTGPTGVATTAVAQEGLLSGFELGLTADGHWQFRLHTPSTTATAVSAGTAGSGAPVYVSGVWDAVNKELRLYVGSGLASITRFDPHAAAGLDGGVTVGGRWAHGAPAELWSGQIGNPVVAQAAFTSTDVAQLAGETFFPNPNGDLG